MTGLCINGCDKPVEFKGLCKSCYRRRKYEKSLTRLEKLKPSETEITTIDNDTVKVTVRLEKLITDSGIRPGHYKVYLDNLVSEGLIRSYTQHPETYVLTIILDRSTEFFFEIYDK